MREKSILIKKPSNAPTTTSFLIAWSRVVVGVHYKSDVVVGALLGFFISMLFSLI